MKYTEAEKYKALGREYLNKANIILTEDELNNLEVADFALNEFEKTGLVLHIYVNTNRVCAKELVLLPNQTCPEHRHPEVNGKEGKEETFRCRYGTVYLYVDGAPAPENRDRVPKGDEAYYTIFNEIVLKPGEQYTLYPNTKHWFQAGEEGAVVSEFSTTSTDENDIFSDTRIQRIPQIEE